MIRINNNKGDIMKKTNIRKALVSTVFSAVIACSALPSVMSASAASPSIETALNWAVSIANDNSHGYSQTNRQGPDYDCSSLVCNALKKGGFSIGGATYTGNMKDALTKNGFEWIPWSQIGSTSKLKRGDILLYHYNGNKGHTEFYLGNNKNVGARGTYGHPEQGDQTGKEIVVAAYNNDGWQGVLRYKGNIINDSTEPAPAMGTVWLTNDIYIFNTAQTLYKNKACTTAAGTIKAKQQKRFTAFYKAANGKDTIGKTSDGYYVYLRKNTALNVNAYVTVNCDVLNVRKGASTSYDIVTRMKRGKTVRVSKYSGTWAYSPDVKGWFSLNYVVG